MSGGVSVQGESLSTGGSLSIGGLCPCGGLCPGGSLTGGYLSGNPPLYGYVWAVRIPLECILVQHQINILKSVQLGQKNYPSCLIDLLRIAIKHSEYLHLNDSVGNLGGSGQ